MDGKINPRVDNNQGIGFGQKLRSFLGLGKARQAIAPAAEPAPSPTEVRARRAVALVTELFADRYIHEPRNQQLFRLIGLAQRGKLEPYEDGGGSWIRQIGMREEARFPVTVADYASDKSKASAAELNRILADLGVFPHPRDDAEDVALPVAAVPAGRPKVPGGPDAD